MQKVKLQFHRDFVMGEASRDSFISHGNLNVSGGKEQS